MMFFFQNKIQESGYFNTVIIAETRYIFLLRLKAIT